ncbi:hypothetical protein BGX20_007592, partial [Mortierella sp. AD010]
TFPDGTKLVTVHYPISNDNGNLELALHGSFLPIPDADRYFPPISEAEEIASQHPPGAIITAPGTLTLNKGRQRLRLEITNTGDRPILLVPRELDKLVLHQVGYLAQKRLARGLRLNETETVALIASQLSEFIRDGHHSVADLMDLGKQFLGRRQVLPGVAETLHE